MSDPADYLTSKTIIALLSSRRDNDVKVQIQGNLVPIKDIVYNVTADTIVIELVEGADYRIALSCDHDLDGA